MAGNEEIQIAPGVFILRPTDRTPEAAPIALVGQTIPRASAPQRSGTPVDPWHEQSFETWGNILDHTAQRSPEREAIVFGAERITYRQLQARTNLLDRGLLPLGINKAITWRCG